MFGYEILQSYNELEMLVYNYVMEHKEQVRFMTIRELADAFHVSTSTILRFCKKTGCEGYSEFRIQFKLYLKEEKENRKKLLQDEGVDELVASVLVVKKGHEINSRFQIGCMVPCVPI